MPIIRIELVVEDDEPAVAASTIQALADQLGTYFGTGEAGTWVSLRYTPRDHYAENGQRDTSIRPTIVRILQYQRPAAAQLAIEAAELTRLIAALLDRPPENTHLIYEADGKGRVAFGGTLAE